MAERKTKTITLFNYTTQSPTGTFSAVCFAFESVMTCAFETAVDVVAIGIRSAIEFRYETLVDICACVR